MKTKPKSDGTTAAKRRAKAHVRVTMADVAAHAGVSRMTVSRVISGNKSASPATIRLVEESIRALGFRPNIVARGLKVSRTFAAGIQVPDIANPYFPAIVRGAEDTAFESGYTLFLSNVVEDPEREAKSLEAFEDRRVDGVIICSPRLPQNRLNELLRRLPAAVVVNRRVPLSLAGSVQIDYRHGMQQAVSHLFEIGRRRVAVLAGPERSFAGRQRHIGAVEAFSACELDVAPEDWYSCAPTMHGGMEATARVLERTPNVDALLCFNDLVAIGAIQQLKDNGVNVPGDVSVIGHDDIDFARLFSPSLTTLSVNMHEVGVRAMELLLSRIAGEAKQAEVVLKPKLEIRRSTV